MIAISTLSNGARGVVLMAVVMCVGACHRPSLPALATVPFDVSRKGQSVSIPVLVTSENASLDSQYILGVFFRDESPNGATRMLRGYPARQRLYLRVRVCPLINGAATAVRIDDRDVDYDASTGTFTTSPSMSTRKTDVAYVHPSGNRGDVVDMESAHFVFPAYGQYRVDVETLADMPGLYSTPSWLTVQRDFPHGK